MYISARAIVEKMEEQLLQLANELEAGNKERVKSHALVLQSYCDVLLSVEEKSTGKEEFRGEIRSERAKQSISSKRTIQAEIPSTEGNLLEF